MVFSRRFFLASSVAALSAGTCARALSAPRSADENGEVVAPPLLQRAHEALERHRIEHRDFMGVVDFSLPSRAARFHVVNLASGKAKSYLVAHGRGSDPTHTGWLEHFSNDPGSYATSAGAFRTGSLYVGAHGRSMHLDGLDPTNSNAASRAIVVHGAWYVSEVMVDHLGMLGRSEGCFAVSNSSLGEIIADLGPGRLIYADKA